MIIRCHITDWGTLSCQSVDEVPNKARVGRPPAKALSPEADQIVEAHRRRLKSKRKSKP